jgi:hypothetical protein
MNATRGTRRLVWALIPLLIVLASLAVLLAVPPLRILVLRAAGWALVVNEPVAPADIIVVSLASESAGPLEAADLVQSGIAERVAVFADPARGADLEFIRRGLPYENAALRQIRQLKLLGVTDVVEIPMAEDGSEAEGWALSRWCSQRGFRSAVFVVARDHSRRVRRILDRATKGGSTHVTVRPARHSTFDPDRWWETRNGVRTEIVELQKLVLDVARHALSF